MTEMDNLDVKLGSYFEFSFIVTDVGNLYAILRDNFEISFIMTDD
jgi:hypothetical protein